MKKKTFLISIGVLLTILIAGIILVCASSTPYSNCSYWANDPSSPLYFYGKANVSMYAGMYFSGIAMAIVGGIGAILVFVRNILAKKEKTLSENITNNLD